ncbi:TPA: hypothetical protein ACQUH6_000690 [Neisseria polysaccharea]|uniref:hypothetical protein n=1 Tax=Neisseria polysaccharea TaxID=489 RepID=UPI0027DFE945|nr:hypothetical protein [Neisseria polysaccharea]
MADIKAFLTAKPEAQKTDIAALVRKQAAIAYRTDKKIEDNGLSRDKPAEIPPVPLNRTRQIPFAKAMCNFARNNPSFNPCKDERQRTEQPAQYAKADKPQVLVMDAVK